MFDVSVADAGQAVLDMLEVLLDVNEEFSALKDRVDSRVEARRESKDEARSRIGKRLNIVRQLRSDVDEFTNDISAVTKELRESHDKLIQTLGDVLLSCDIDDVSQMSRFENLMEAIQESENLVGILIAMSSHASEKWSEGAYIPRATISTVDDLSRELRRVHSVYTRMIHLSEYFS